MTIPGSIEQSRKLIAEERTEAEAELAEMRERHEQEASDLIERIETLGVADERLAALNGASAPAADPPSSGRGSSRPTPRPTSTPPAAAPATGQRKAMRERSKHHREAAVAFVRANPGCTQAELARGANIAQGTIAGVVQGLLSRQMLRAEKEGPRKKRLYPYEAPALPADEAGAKSEQERKIVECLRAADGPLPPSEISIRTGIRSDHVPSMCQAMTNRRVIARIPPKASGRPPRYEPIKRTRTMADRR